MGGFEHLRRLVACQGLRLEATGDRELPWRLVCVDGYSDFDNRYSSLADAWVDYDGYVASRGQVAF